MIHPGTYLLETVPRVIDILMRHGGNPEVDIVRAASGHSASIPACLSYDH